MRRFVPLLLLLALTGCSAIVTVSALTDAQRGALTAALDYHRATVLYTLATNGTDACRDAAATALDAVRGEQISAQQWALTNTRPTDYPTAYREAQRGLLDAEEVCQ